MLSLKNIISIHSAPRSGSTWLQAVLESHPEITTRFQPLFSYAFKNRVNSETTVELYHKFIQDLYFTQDKFVLSESDFHKKHRIELPKLYKTNKEQITMVMKNVHNHHVIKHLLNLDPTVKIIGLIRDPFATVNSYIQTKSEYRDDWLDGSNKNVSEDDYWGYLFWKKTVDTLLEAKKNSPNNVIIIKYEQLVLNSESEFEKLFKFIGVTFDKTVKQFIKDSLSCTKSVNHTNSEYSVMKDSSMLNINRWQNTLDPLIINFIKEDLDKEENVLYKQYVYLD